jgi:serine/threonine protein kinase
MANPEDLGRYRLKRLLGRGDLGEVWEATARDQEGQKVAVKIMHAADEELTHARHQFAREARLAAIFRHPHVARVLDAGEAAGTSFMVMEMVEGTSLRKLLGDPATTRAEKLRWLRQIGDGLAALHRAGLVHRDLKPENVIVRADRTACIVDLGIAKWTKYDLGGERDLEDLEDDHEAPPPNADYAPPEATDEEDPVYDELGDQFAWGVLAHAVLTGSPPKEGAPALGVDDDVTSAVAMAILRARSPRREDRWDAMELLLDEIVIPPASVAGMNARVASSANLEAAPTSAPAAPTTVEVEEDKPVAAPSPSPAKPFPVALVAVAAVLGLVVLGLIWATIR